LANDGFLTSAQKREAEQCERLRAGRIRATILTGFLGAGKTTFLNFVLKSWHGKRIGVVQNEFGSVSVDDQLMLVEKSEAEVITMPNGCLCCRVRGDMVDALRRLAQGPGAEAFGRKAGDDAPALDGLLIECSGLSEVIPVAQTFFADPFVQASFQLDGVVCVCDAANFEAFEGGSDLAAGGAVAGAEVARLLREQLSISDVCLLNKCDLVESASRDRLSARMRELSPSIKVIPCRHGKVNLNQVLKLDAFSLEATLSLDAHFLDDGQRWHGDGQGTGRPPRQRLCPWPGGVRGNSERAPHAHTAFGSLGLETRDEIDVESLKEWLRSVVERHGDRLVRLKGLLRTRGHDGRRGYSVVQGVGGHIEVGEDAQAPPAGGSGRLVLIGRLLDADLQAELRAGFAALAASAGVTAAAGEAL